jgi:hypothetical protein
MLNNESISSRVNAIDSIARILCAVGRMKLLLLTCMTFGLTPKRDPLEV